MYISLAFPFEDLSLKVQSHTLDLVTLRSLLQIMASSDSDINISEKTTPAIDSSLDAEAGNIRPARLDEFGKLLVPTLTPDPLDQLNWTNIQKYTIMAIACFSYFTTAPVASFTLLQV